MIDGKIKVTESGIEFTSPKTMDMAHDVAIHYLEHVEKDHEILELAYINTYLRVYGLVLNGLEEFGN